jgi:hypothetical protein
MIACQWTTFCRRCSLHRADRWIKKSDTVYVCLSAADFGQLVSADLRRSPPSHFGAFRYFPPFASSCLDQFTVKLHPSDQPTRGSRDNVSHTIISTLGDGYGSDRPICRCSIVAAMVTAGHPLVRASRGLTDWASIAKGWFDYGQALAKERQGP